MSYTEEPIQLVQTLELENLITDAVQKAVAPLRREVNDLRKSMQFGGGGGGAWDDNDDEDSTRFANLIGDAMNHVEPLMEKGIDIYAINQCARRGHLPSEHRLDQIEKALVGI